MKINIEGLGIRNAKTESAQIIWFLSQKIKNMQDGIKVSCILTFKKNNSALLLENECYDILAFIDRMVTREQEHQRERQTQKADKARKLKAIEAKKIERNFIGKIHIRKLFEHYNTPN
jgi:hypothetical protein